MIARQPGQGDAPHVDLPVSMADVVSGLHGVIAVLAALRHRDATGEGNHIDLAMVDALLASDDVAPALITGSIRDDGASMTNIVDAPGGPLVVMGEFKWIWKSIHERCGVPDPAGPDADVPDQGAAASPGVARLRRRVRHARGAVRCARPGQPRVGRGQVHGRGGRLPDDRATAARWSS